MDQRPSLDDQRWTVTYAIRQGDQAIARGDWALALDHYRSANAPALKVAQTGGADRDHAVLGSVYYNLAELHVRTGDIATGWLTALQACKVYGRLDPTRARPSAVRSCVSGTNRGRAEERVALNADARSRYVLLCAGLVDKVGSHALRADVGDSPLDRVTDLARVIKRIGEPAVRTYEELVRHGQNYTRFDVSRTRSRIVQARTVLGT
ncbi:hypothetical protein OG946_10245 [Streptomyces sp. NBC_01808]|uniref:hypothetical protein n=1 Tax=Streptomyces sp. NBC_01808 TaxID=2975947 RepID=UPI002DDBE004|nr:hypothetical protein [Streptomyces sp. NBC_01808]WSA37737.1 hypothetical protein OG946_10245 [Streptomyces sp. NBC_01808]